MAGKPQLKALSPVDIADYAVVLRPFIDKAAAFNHGEYATDDVLALCQRGAMQCFVIYDESQFLGVCVTEIVTYPRLTRIRVVTASGKQVFRWGRLMRDYLRKWRDSAGFSGIEGWTRTDEPFQKLVSRLGGQCAYTVVLDE